jgi:hypothetical protein
MTMSVRTLALIMAIFTGIIFACINSRLLTFIVITFLAFNYIMYDPVIRQKFEEFVEAL